MESIIIGSVVIVCMLWYNFYMYRQYSKACKERDKTQKDCELTMRGLQQLKRKKVQLEVRKTIGRCPTCGKLIKT